MKKILFINTLYSPYIGGGAEIMFQHQVEELQARGYEVCVLTTGKNKNLMIESLNGIKIYRAGIKNFYWHYGDDKSNNKIMKLLWHLRDIYNVQMKKYIQTVINVENPDLTICHNLAGFSVSAWDVIKKNDLKIVQVLHDMYFLCANSTMFQNDHKCEKQCLKCKLLRYIHKKKSQQVDVLVGVSHFVINKMNYYNYFNSVNKKVIYNAQDIKYYNIEKIWDGKEVFKIGFIGSLTKSKGIEWLISQFNKLNINATLLIAGKGEIGYEKFLIELSNNNKIKFLGYVKSSDFYKKVDLICIPSICEDNFPGVAYEASANNIPVIASNTGGMAEIISDQVNGILIDPNDENTLGNSILKIYNNVDFYKKLASQSRKQVENLLNIDRMLNEYEIIINDL